MILIIIYTIQVFSLSAITGIFDSWHMFQPIKSLIVLLGLFGALNYFKITNIKNLLSNAIFIHSIIMIIFIFFLHYKMKLILLLALFLEVHLELMDLHNYGTTSLMHIKALPILLNSADKFKKLKSALF